MLSPDTQEHMEWLLLSADEWWESLSSTRSFSRQFNGKALNHSCLRRLMHFLLQFLERIDLKSLITQKVQARVTLKIQEWREPVCIHLRYTDKWNYMVSNHLQAYPHPLTKILLLPNLYFSLPDILTVCLNICLRSLHPSLQNAL
jgi:hypothetical protein